MENIIDYIRHTNETFEKRNGTRWTVLSYVSWSI